MGVSVICPGCGKRLHIPDDYARAKIRCECGVMCEVPKGARKSTPAASSSRQTGEASSSAAPPDSVEDAAFSALTAAEPSAAVPREAELPVPVDLRPEEPDYEFSDHDDGKPYAVTGGSKERKCPGCSKLLLPKEVLCVRCGYDLRTGKKPVRVYQKLERRWEAGLPHSTRKTLFFAGQGVFGVIGVLGILVAGDLVALVVSWVVFTAMTAFLLGTFDRLDLVRNKKGQVQLTKTWRICFLIEQPTKIDLREYEGIACGTADETDFWDWVIFVGLLPWGAVPAVLWFFFAIHKITFNVALSKDHGYPACTLYRGRNEAQMKDIAETLHDAAGLPLQRG